MATALTDCSDAACIVAASPDFQHLQVGFSPSASQICSFCEPWFAPFASRICSFCKPDLLFCKSDLLLLRVGFALLQVGFVPFALSWFPPFGSGRQNWTGRRQNAVTNRPETGLWQPGEYILAHHFQLNVKSRQRLFTDKVASGCYFQFTIFD